MEFFEIRDKKINTLSIIKKIDSSSMPAVDNKSLAISYEVLSITDEDEKSLYNVYFKKKQLQKSQTPYFLFGKFYLFYRLIFKITKLFYGESIENKGLFNDNISKEIVYIAKKLNKKRNNING